MLDKKNIFSFFFLVSVSFVIGEDVDYLLGNSLRTKNKDVCYSVLYELYCKFKCGPKSGMCIEKHCYCLFVVQSNNNESPQMIYVAKPYEPLKKINLDLEDSRYNGDEEERGIQPELTHLDQSMIYSLRPALRHHIAHFCPNLNVARECIRTCMKVGKPAFCGKDHVCYCGHKYSSTDDNSVGNLEETYGQFRDLYEKYLGSSHHVKHE